MNNINSIVIPMLKNLIVCYIFVTFFLFGVIDAYALAARNINREIERAQSFYREGELEQASRIYRNILEDYKGGREEKEMARALRYGGNICVISGHPVNALEFYLASLKIARKNNDSSNIESTLVNIGVVYCLFGDYDQAVLYFEKAIRSAGTHDNNYGRGVAYANLTYAYCELGYIDKAYESLEGQKKFPLQDSIAHDFCLLHNEGIILRISGFLEKALENQRQAGEEVKGIPDYSGEAVSAFVEMAKIFDKKVLPDSAAAYLYRGLGLADDERSIIYLPSVYEELSRHYRALGMTDSVYKYQTLFYEISDSLYNSNLYNRARGKIGSYDVHETDTHIQHLRDTIIWLSVLIGLFMAVVGVYVTYAKKLRKANKLLVEKNEEFFRQIETTDALLKEYAKTEIAEGNQELSQPRASTLRVKDNLCLLTKIQDVMQRPDVISNPDFSLPQLAEMVGSNTSYVSAVINDTFGKNFKSYLNEYRVKEACRRLSDPAYANITLAAIASEVGFRTQTNFILNFKKVTGVTPSLYRSMLSKPSS